jgi:hypothetical protein
LSGERRLSIGLPASIPSVSPLEAALNVAHAQYFPLFKIVFAETNKKQVYETRVEVAPSVFKFLASAFNGNETVVFLDMTPTRSLGLWGGDMMESFRLLSKVNLMSPLDRWLYASRERISKSLSNEKGELVPSSQAAKEAFDTSQQLLKAAALLSDVEASEDLMKVANDVLQSGKKDLDTAIYRLGMAVYHAPRISGQPLVQGLENPAKVYLDFTSDQLAQTRFKEVVDSMVSREGAERQEFVRTLMSLVIGAYVCNKALLRAGRH